MSHAPTPRTIAERTERIGREILERLRGDQPWFFQPPWWEERLLRICMSNEWYKVQSFRFIDALPALHNDQEIAEHLHEYFVHPMHVESAFLRRQRNDHHRGAFAGDAAALAELDPPPAGDVVVRLVSAWMNWRTPSALRARLTAWLARKVSFAMAGRFIAGSNIQQAERAIVQLRAQRMAFTIDVLGEAALSRSEAEHYHRTYLDLITQLPARAAGWAGVPQIDAFDGRSIPRVNVSVKITSLHPGFDAIAPEAALACAKDRLRPLLRSAIADGVHVHIDMEHYAVKDLTLQLCRELFMEPEFRDYPHFGIVLQAYLRDADRDVADTIAWCRRRGTPIWVRLVKGAYWDTETVLVEREKWPCPVWTRKWESDACYERCTRQLIENHDVIRTAFASHNVRSLAHALALRDLFDVPGTAFETQMLYGMGDPIKRALVDRGERCRVYTPYGEILPGMAYLIRRLLENTSNESFLRHSVDAETPVEELLRDPAGTSSSVHGRKPPESDGLHPDTNRRAAHEPPGRGLEYARAYSGSASPLATNKAESGAKPGPAEERFVNAADADLTRPDVRQRLIAAIHGIREQFGRRIPLIIDGQRIVPATLRESRNPARPVEIIGLVGQADAEAADRAVSAARSAFSDWRAADVRDRAATLQAAARQLEERRTEFAALTILEAAKPWREADAEVSEAIDYLNYYAIEAVRRCAHPRRRDVPGESNEYFYAPRGVAAVLSPWNFPLAITAGMLAAPLVTGNTVVFKPASNAGIIAHRLFELLELAGVPAGALNFLPGSGELVGNALVGHPDVATIVFTGSREAGIRINRLAGETPSARPAIKRVVAEMGAKNAIIIDADADLDEAIKGSLTSAFGYAGQKCSAASRLIVLDAVHDRFMERFVEAVGSLSIGAAEEPTTSMPPLIDRAAQERVREWIKIGKREATCVLEVDVSRLCMDSGGYYVGPVIFDPVSPGASIAQEEVFGPIVCVLRARNIDEAITIFNNCPYGLAGGIFSRSPANIERARNECECGNFYINRRITGSRVELQPFGGVKFSGAGARVGGPDYLTEFCEPRTISENTLRRGFAPSAEVAGSLG